LGGIGGLVLSFILAKLFGAMNFRMPEIPGGAQGFVAFIRFPLSAALLLKVFFITLSSTVLASMIPAFRVSRWPVVRALGYV
jgi:ABC-type lipoprotein release transport system permease subunit